MKAPQQFMILVRIPQSVCEAMPSSSYELDRILLFALLQQEISGTYQINGNGTYRKLLTPRKPRHEEIFEYDFREQDVLNVSNLYVVSDFLGNRDLKNLDRDNGAPFLSITLTNPLGSKCIFSMSLKKIQSIEGINGTGYVFEYHVEPILFEAPV